MSESNQNQKFAIILIDRTAFNVLLEWTIAADAGRLCVRAGLSGQLLLVVLNSVRSIQSLKRTRIGTKGNYGG